MSVTIPKQELVDTDKLKVDGQNPNKMTDKQLKRLNTSVEKYGFIVPIITNKDLLIADGEQRLAVAKDMGMPQVPVVRLPVEDVDRRLLRQVLNKLRGEHELIADAMEFERIIKAGHEDDLKHLLDLNDSQLERYLAEIHEPKPEDYEIPEIDKIKTTIKRGDIYKLGTHRLMCGDATSPADVEALMNGEKADMVFTDPPYNVGLDYEGYTDNKKLQDYLFLIQQAFSHIANSLKDGSGVYVMSGERYRFHLEGLLRKYFHFHQLLLWIKNATKGWGDYQFNYEAVMYGWKEGTPHRFYSLNTLAATNIINTPKGHKRTIHPAQRPIALVSTYIQNSTLKTEKVLDVFGGSGSTLIACEQTGRQCRMMEIDARYCQVIINRWQAYTGQKAEKLN